MSESCIVEKLMKRRFQLCGSPATSSTLRCCDVNLASPPKKTNKQTNISRDLISRKIENLWCHKPITRAFDGVDSLMALRRWFRDDRQNGIRKINCHCTK